MERIKIDKEVFATQKRTVLIYKAYINGESCYAVLHQPTGHIELFDYDPNILKAVKDKAIRTHSIQLDKKTTTDILKFPKRKREQGISLKLYLYAKYEGLPPGKVKGRKIELLDRNMVDENILDLRSKNLYSAGDSRPKTRRREIEIIQNPNNPNVEQIHIRMIREGLDAYAPYTPELYEMLTSSKYCSLGVNKSKTRVTVVVHCAHKKDGYTIVTLAKFLCIYAKHFSSYQKQFGAVKRFIHDFDKLNGRYDGVDAAHLNACTFDNSFNNLMLMDNKTNNEMDEYAKYFIGDYSFLPALNEDGEILAAFTLSGTTLHFLCKTPEDYADLQCVLLGKRLTGSLQEIRTAGGENRLMPCGMLKTGAVGRKKKNTPGTDIGAYWKMIQRRTELLSMRKDRFILYDRNAIGTLNGMVRCFAGICGVPCDNVVVLITPIEKQGA